MFCRENLTIFFVSSFSVQVHLEKLGKLIWYCTAKAIQNLIPTRHRKEDIEFKLIFKIKIELLEVCLFFFRFYTIITGDDD